MTRNRSPSGPRPLRVLVVDDSLLIQRLAASMLTRSGHQVDVAGNGDDALHLLAARQVDLVLMDVQMPGMDGPMTTARLRELGHQTPVVALTASSQSEEWRRCQAAGMNDYLAKPFGRPDLSRIVERWGRGGPMTSAAAEAPARRSRAQRRHPAPAPEPADPDAALRSYHWGDARTR